MVHERALIGELALRDVAAKAQVSWSAWRTSMAQGTDYVQASGLRVALQIHFQRPKVEWKRVLLDQQLQCVCPSISWTVH